MASVLSCSSHNTCMICLSSLLRHPKPTTHRQDTTCNRGDDVSSVGPEDESENEIGAVVPCGHVFHIKCWQLWAAHEGRCPTCNQDAAIFCKLFISAPPLPSPSEHPPSPPSSPQPQQKSQQHQQPEEEAQAPVEEISFETRLGCGTSTEEEEEEEQRQILLDMRTAEQQGPAHAIRKVVSLQSKVRKLRRTNRATRKDLESTQLMLDLTQEELTLANQELQQQQSAVHECKDKLWRLQTQHWQRHKILHEELVERHQRQIKGLQKELDDVKTQLAFRNNRRQQQQQHHWAGHNSNAAATAISTVTATPMMIACRGPHVTAAPAPGLDR
ncbi:expressed unknown protein [Seminavis robusta]|uniref:RING-type domain-containing protein n=1 Tax=Seminavis robusta TaxID=568900 RepID=A0A9N8GZN5_9STRA|nr:expressed unknown protein [Seminavis robusta]|eukprot:Sro6_g005240.1 n/a (329) ;mRNA; f:131640-132626